MAGRVKSPRSIDSALDSAARAPAEDGSSRKAGSGELAARVRLSLVVPVHDEEPNLRPLVERVRSVLGEESAWELVLVDDGSRDRSAELVRELAREDPRVRGIFFARRCGQTTAIKAGVESAKGAWILTLDADLQNDPADIPAMLAALGQHDAVVGWRVRRQDSFVRRASSLVARWVRNAVLADSIRDTGCSLKLFRAEAIRAIPLFEGMHRFLPTLLSYHGFSVVEHPVSHHPRRAGRSKYGIRNRAWRATSDLFAVRWMRTRIVRAPILEQEELGREEEGARSA